MLGTKLRLQPELDIEMVSVFLMQMLGSNLDAAQACRRAATHAGPGLGSHQAGRCQCRRTGVTCEGDLEGGEGCKCP